MRRLSVVVVVTLAFVMLAACAKDDAPSASDQLPEREIAAGDITVTIRPVRVAADGAEFAVAFDTHTVDLDLDVARNARLSVDGTEWTGAAWDGAGPGGHHREGTLRFSAKGAAAGEAVLTIDGLEAPATARWTVGKGG